jgi:hypothetical protein
MPVVFGPTYGPRQVPEGVAIRDATTHRKTTLSVLVQAPEAQLARLMPPRFTLRGTPRILFDLSYMTEIDWLGGRGYNLLGVKIPATFTGAQETIHGMFYAVLWESLTDPILSGRDELGAPKLYADIREPRVFQGRQHHAASWCGFTFATLEVAAGVERPGAAPSMDADNQGNLQWKYVPRTGAPGTADVSVITFTPVADPNLATVRHWDVEGCSLRFHRARWEDLPTMYHVVNALADIDLGHVLRATVSETRGFKDLGDTRVVE